jgi:hypothetical protein
MGSTRWNSEIELKARGLPRPAAYRTVVAAYRTVSYGFSTTVAAWLSLAGLACV